MKEFIKKHALPIAIVGAVIFLAIFLSFIFHRVGDDVYIVGVNGTVNIGNSSDLNNLKPAAVGMRLSKNDIIVTNDMSSCVVSYNKKATEKDNFVNVGENSQVMIYDRNSQGGYKFFITYGSVICNMPIDKSYRTNISTKTFNVFADGTITKISYNSADNVGKVFTFDGNPRLQIIQPSGSTNAAEKLLKNSVCAVSKMDDGTIGFGCLNVGFGLNSLTAQDLKVMSGVANVWSEKISYGVNEFEQAFQTASDYAKWTVTDPAVISTADSVAESLINSDTYIPETSVPEMFTGSDEVTAETTVGETKPTAATQTVPEKFMDYDDEDVTRPSSEETGLSLPITTFHRETVINLDDNDVKIVTTVPEDRDEDNSSSSTRGTRVTEPYDKETIVTAGSNDSHQTTTASTTRPGSASTTRPNKPASTSSPKTTTAPSYNTGTKPVINTTVPNTPADPNGVYTVIFSYSVGDTEYWSVQLVKYGQSAIAPATPVVPGKKFVGWSREYNRVTSNMEIIALFVESDGSVSENDTFTVNFYVDSRLWKTVTVKRGDSIKLNQIPDFDDKSLVFCGWSDSLTDIQSDMTVFSLFRTK